jgi:hypothetical protein
MDATPIYLREQAVNEELTTRVVPNEDTFTRPAAKSPSDVVMWLAGRDFALFCPPRGRIVCHQKRKDRRARTPTPLGRLQLLSSHDDRNMEQARTAQTSHYRR